MFFHWRNMENIVPVDVLLRYFRERPFYKVGKEWAGYANEVTGVGFGFEVVWDWVDEEDDFVPLVFEINYFRPHIFGLEAAIELEEFVKQFDLQVSDVEGMGEGEYSQKKFFRVWDKGNRRACQVFGGMVDPSRFYFLPTEVIVGVWKWNYAYSTGSLGEREFVPRILYLEYLDRVRRGVVWSEERMLMPEVDMVLTPWKRDGVKEVFGARRRVVAEWAAVEWGEIEEVLESGGDEGVELPVYRVKEGMWGWVMEVARQKGALRGQVKVVPPRWVMNEEFFKGIDVKGRGGPKVVG